MLFNEDILARARHERINYLSERAILDKEREHTRKNSTYSLMDEPTFLGKITQYFVKILRPPAK